MSNETLQFSEYHNQNAERRTPRMLMTLLLLAFCVTFASSGCGRKSVEKISKEIHVPLVKISAGSFQRGKYTVTISKDYWIGQYEVTQEAWNAIMEVNTSSYCTSKNNPVEGISYDDAKEFCDRLNKKYAEKLPEGYHFDLPTEAQWEYACLAGNTDDFYSKCLDGFGWYCRNSNGQPHEVGKKKPNAWGLYDMYGNVSELCRDWHGPYPQKDVTDPEGPEMGAGRVECGGAWSFNGENCRADIHCCCAAEGADDLGFRLALVPIQK